MAKINGTGGVDNLSGTVNDDVFDGGFGADTMTGGLGSDIYYVDNVADSIVENIGEGTEKVYSSLSYTLPANVEHLTLTGTSSINAIGNNWDNILTGNRGNNILNGGAGADTMIGGAGDDIYFISIFSTDGINDNPLAGDFIIDRSGNDTVTGIVPDSAETLYILQKDLENAVFSGGDDNKIILTGNQKANTLTTGDADDTIDGGKGADTMDGGDGKNIFYVDNKNDLIIDTHDDMEPNTDYPVPSRLPIEEDADTAYISTSYVMASAANIEYIILTGNKGLKVTGSDTDNDIVGTTAADTIRGGAGEDVIHGGGGKDILWGGAGADSFYFDTDTAFTAPVTIKDFNVAEGDVLDITDIISGFTDGIAVSGYVHIFDKGKDTVVQVNASGDTLAEHYITIAVIDNVIGLTGESALYSSENLIMLHS